MATLEDATEAAKQRKRKSGWDSSPPQFAPGITVEGPPVKQPTPEETQLALLKTKQLLAQESLQRSLAQASGFATAPALITPPVALPLQVRKAPSLSAPTMQTPYSSLLPNAAALALGSAPLSLGSLPVSFGGQIPVLSLPQIAIAPGLNVPGIAPVLGGHPLSGVPAPTSTPAGERLDCRIYVGSLQYDIKAADIHALFSCFGPITSVDMSHDSVTGKSKGFCFVEFAEPCYAKAAMAMDGFELGGRKIKIGHPNGGSGGVPANIAKTPLVSPFDLVQLPPAAQALLGAATLGTPPPLLNASALAGVIKPPLAMLGTGNQKRRIKISNVRSEVGSDELKSIFQSFGAIIECDFICPPIPSIQNAEISVRIAEIAFNKAEAAYEAMKSMNNFELGGFKMIIELIEDCASQIATQAARAAQMAAAAIASKLAALNNKIVGATSSGSQQHAVGVAGDGHKDVLKPAATSKWSSSPSPSASAFKHPTVPAEQEAPPLVSPTPSPAPAAAALPPLSLAVPAIVTPATPAVGNISLSVNKSSNNLPCKVLLEGLATVDEANDPNLKEEVAEEASRYGTLERVHIGLNAAGVVAVSLLYQDHESAQRAHQAMNGRFFGGRSIKSKLVSE